MRKTCAAIAAVLAGCQLLTAAPAAAAETIQSRILPPAERTYQEPQDGLNAVCLIPNGTIGAYDTDLNRDGTQERLEVFLRDGEREGRLFKQICIRFDAGDAAGWQEFVLCELLDYAITDFKLYYCETAETRCFVSSWLNMVAPSAGGIPSITHVLCMNDKKQLYAETSLIDPGYTSAVGIYQVGATVDFQIAALWYPNGSPLYEWDSSEGGDADTDQYYQVINQALAPYGATAAPHDEADSTNFWTELPFTVYSDNPVVAALSGERNGQDKTVSFRYSGNHPAGEPQPEPPSDFQPEVFYRNILNENRPEYATGFRFLDLDYDGREELLLGGFTMNSIWAPIDAVYTYDAATNAPKKIDLKYNPYDGGEGGCFVSYTVGFGGTIHYSSGIDFDPVFIDVLYCFSDGMLVPVFGIAENRNTKIAYYTLDYAELAVPGQYQYSGWDTCSIGDSVYQVFHNILDVTNDIKPNLTYFEEYDTEQEYRKTHPETTLAASGVYGYDALLAQYQEMLAAPESMWPASEKYGTSCLSTDSYSAFWSTAFQDMVVSNTFNPCFVLRDLNGDGSPELATGHQDEDGCFTLFDLYTVYEGQVIHLASSYPRNLFSIRDDLAILENRFRGAMQGANLAYTIKNGKLEVIHAMAFEMSEYDILQNAETAAESWEHTDYSNYFGISDAIYVSDTNQPVTLFSEWQPGWALSGDMNADGAVSLADAVLLARFVAEDTSLTDAQTERILSAGADTDTDGLVTVSDVAALLHTLCV